MESLFQMEVLTASLQITCWIGLDSGCVKLHVVNDVICLLSQPVLAVEQHSRFWGCLNVGMGGSEEGNMHLSYSRIYYRLKKNLPPPPF